MVLHVHDLKFNLLKIFILYYLLFYIYLFFISFYIYVIYDKWQYLQTKIIDSVF